MSGIDQYTKLLLHANGTGQTFVDSEIVPKTVTANGNVTQSATQSKFGGKSAYFDGSGDYLSLADSDDWNFSSGDFTVDFWFYAAAWTLYAGYVFQGETAGNLSVLSIEQTGAGHVRFLMRNSTGLIIDITTTGWTPALNTWIHVACVKNGTTFTIYINGTARASTTSTVSITDNPYGLGIGWRNVGDNSPTYYQGYMDEIRISKGIARWTSSFTPPTAEYDATQAITNAGGIVTAEAFGSPTVLPGAVSVYPESIPSAEAFGSPVILPGQVTIQPPGIESAEIFGSPIIIPDAVTVQPVRILSEEAFGTPVVSIPSQIIQPPGIESAEIFGSPIITPGAVTVQPSGIPSQEAFGNPLITPGAVTITPPGIPSAEVFGSLSVLPGEVIIRPLSISSLEAFGMPRVYRIPKSIQVALEAFRFKVAAETARLEVKVDG